MAKAHGLASVLPSAEPAGIQQRLFSLHKGRLRLDLCSSLEEVRQCGRTGSCCHWGISDLPRTDHARKQQLIHRLESPSSQNTLAGAVRRCWRVPVLKLASTWSPKTETTLRAPYRPLQFSSFVGKRGLGALNKDKIKILK